MKREFVFSGDPVQDLLNAVVVQAAEDHREAFVERLEKPGSFTAKEMLEETEAFFLSEDFRLYTTANGRMILERLQEEEADVEETVRIISDLQKEFLCAWTRFRASGEREVLEEACALRDELWKIRNGLPQYAKPIAGMSAEEKEIMGEIGKWEEGYGITEA